MTVPGAMIGTLHWAVQGDEFPTVTDPGPVTLTLSTASPLPLSWVESQGRNRETMPGWTSGTMG